MVVDVRAICLLAVSNLCELQLNNLTVAGARRTTVTVTAIVCDTEKTNKHKTVSKPQRVWVTGSSDAAVSRKVERKKSNCKHTGFPIHVYQCWFDTCQECQHCAFPPVSAGLVSLVQNCLFREGFWWGGRWHTARLPVTTSTENLRTLFLI